jgi:hypothetical protein
MTVLDGPCDSAWFTNGSIHASPYGSGGVVASLVPQRQPIFLESGSRNAPGFNMTNGQSARVLAVVAVAKAECYATGCSLALVR